MVQIFEQVVGPAQGNGSSPRVSSGAMGSFDSVCQSVETGRVIVCAGVEDPNSQAY